MSHAEMIRVEKQAHADLCRDADEGSHRRWLAARAAIKREIDATGRPVERWDGSALTMYRIGRYGQVTRRTIDLGARR